MIVFRVDANAQIGLGHLMRCLAVAKELKHLGQETVFITADENPADLIIKNGFRYVCLKSNYNKMEQETGVLSCVLSSLHAGLLLVDSYNVSADYFNRLRESILVAYMDDLADKAYPVDMVINYNISSDASLYQKMYFGSDTILLLGTEYVPLGEQFRQIKLRPLKNKVRNILVMTGGTDPLGISEILARRMSEDPQLKDIFFHVVAGRYSDLNQIRKLSKTIPQVLVHENANILELMLSCDIAVSASGTTLYELCACGVPSVIFSFVDNQLKIREGFGKTGAMMDCGDFRHEKCLQNILHALKNLQGPEKRAELRKRAAKITDGQGASRLAARLMDLLKTE